MSCNRAKTNIHEWRTWPNNLANITFYKCRQKCTLTLSMISRNTGILSIKQWFSARDLSVWERKENVCTCGLHLIRGEQHLVNQFSLQKWSACWYNMLCCYQGNTFLTNSLPQKRINHLSSSQETQCQGIFYHHISLENYNKVLFLQFNHLQLITPPTRGQHCTV